MKQKVNLDYQLFLQREKEFFHQPYNNELKFYAAIRTGNLEYIEKLKKTFDAKSDADPTEGKGVLSKDPVRNERYHLIINTALVTRNCIEGGLPQEDAYTLSDLYIRLADQTLSVRELQELNDDMVNQFTQKMRELRTEHTRSHHITRCIEYIYNHLHQKLTIDTLSREVGLNPSYLAELFKKETGTTIHTFIQDIRLDTARNMLKDSHYSSAEIAAILCFSSQSHFIRQFQKKFGMTPGEYRDNER